MTSRRMWLQMQTDAMMITLYELVQGMFERVLYGIAWAFGVMLGLTLFLQLWKLLKGARGL